MWTGLGIGLGLLAVLMLAVAWILTSSSRWVERIKKQRKELDGSFTNRLVQTIRNSVFRDLVPTCISSRISC